MQFYNNKQLSKNSIKIPVIILKAKHQVHKKGFYSSGV